MNTFRTPIALIIAFLAAIIMSLMQAPAASAATVTINAQEKAALVQINKFRKARGLVPVRVDASLTKVARWHATDMARKNYFSHTDSFGRDPFKRIASFGYPSRNTYRGENIAAGNMDGRSTYLQWLNSPSHKANMQRSQYRAIGIARRCVAASTYNCYWVTNFGSKRDGFTALRVA